MRSQTNKTRQLWLPLLIIIGMVMAFSWIIAGDEFLDNLRGDDQGLSIQDLSTPTPSPSVTPSPSATRTKAAFTSAAILIDTPTPAASATRTEAIFTQKSTFTPNCTFTIHFWRVYTEVWRIESIDLGSRSYSKEQAIALLNIEDPNLVTTRLLQQYITALLNTMKGADPSGIERTIERVREWLILHPPEIRLTQAENLEGERLADELQDFNDGVTGPGRCIEEPFTPTPGATPTPLNYTPPATATNTPGPIGTIFFPTATKKPGGGKPKPTNTPPQPTNTAPPPQPTNTPPPPQPSNTPKPTLVPPTPPPPPPSPTP